ncbi:MAG: DUF58 domain-containing protein [Deltaproteobacteria bacterium]|nr:DUF58 domain-containing protein [Deltaproteobacteria bacterium]
MLTSAILNEVKRLELRTRRLVDSLMAGEYFSIFKGRGLEFYEVREYLPGDEVRAIDWKTTAKTGVPYVRAYVEEKELPVILVVDVSGSLEFGTGGKTKAGVMVGVTAFLGMVALKRNNPLGLVAFSDTIEILLRPTRGRKQFLNIISALLTLLSPEHKRRRGTDVNLAINTLLRVAKRRSLVFLLSDFIAKDYELALATTCQRHDIVPVVFSDVRESILPDVRFVELQDNETGERVTIDTSDNRLRAYFHSQAFHTKKAREGFMMGLGMDFIDISANAPYMKPIKGFFYRRMGRR